MHKSKVGSYSKSRYFPSRYDWVSNVTVRVAPPSGRLVPGLPALLDHIPVWIRGGKTIVQRIPDFQNNLPLEGNLRIIIALNEIQGWHSFPSVLCDKQGRIN